MKLKKIALLCNGQDEYRLYDQMNRAGEVEAQWLGDGGALYPLHGLPYLSEQELYRMFDVPEKKQNKVLFVHEALPEALCVDDFYEGEQPVQDMGVSLSYGGKVLVPLCYPGGILYIQSRYLGPLEDQSELLQFYVRRSPSGERYVVVKTGMLLVGVISPYGRLRESFVERLDEITQLTRWEVERGWSKRTDNDVEDEAQESWFQAQEGEK